jgi:hypothetical protein
MLKTLLFSMNPYLHSKEAAKKVALQREKNHDEN